MFLGIAFLNNFSFLVSHAFVRPATVTPSVGQVKRFGDGFHRAPAGTEAGI